MRSEIQAVIDAMVRSGINGYPNQLQAILDADAVARLEAMGITGLSINVNRELLLVANVKGEHYEVKVQQAAGGKVSDDIDRAATRLLARITEDDDEQG